MLQRSKIVVALAVFSFLGTVAYVSAEETKGTVKSVDTNRNEVVLKGTIKDTVYELNKDATVFLDGIKAKVGDLKEGDKAQITFEKSGEHNKAIYVRALRESTETTGKIADVFMEKKEITLKGTVKNTVYELDKTGTVWIGNKESKLSDLRPGDEVRITYAKRGDHYMATEIFKR